jgi:flagellar assembly protein FliH
MPSVSLSGGEAKAFGKSEEENVSDVKKAYQKGYASGLEAGTGQAKREMEEQWFGLSATLQGLEKLRNQILEQAEGDIIALAFHVARKIIRTEIDQNPEVVVEIVKEAIRKAVDREFLKISLNARDFETLNHRRPELLHGLDGVKKILFEVDESVQPGGCLIETRYGDVDARIDRQIHVIENELHKIS